jgi:UDP-N-acetylglucosamine 1-carboxyvinyltransferase
MQKIRISGGKILNGIIPISGAKNAALPLMAACLLSDKELKLSNIPYLADVITMANLLVQHGVVINMEDKITNKIGMGRTISLKAASVNNFTAPYDLVRTMRASVLVLGPLLARFGQAKVSLPGGCAIGTRPIDLHLKALEQMGALIELSDGYINAFVNGKLKGADIKFDTITVTGTENIMMAATIAEGQTTIRNAAREPEVSDLANCLVKMGAKITGIGTDTLVIQGVDNLQSAEHSVIADRIEAGSYAAAIAITGGSAELCGIDIAIMGNMVEKFQEAGILITSTQNGVKVENGKGLHGVDIMTQAYPGFPTDMQAQMMSLFTVAEGAAMITETIFENRFMHVPELLRMGAKITVHGSSAMVRGVKNLTGAEVMATDLRASMSLVIAALAAKGDTVINRIYHLDRGYEMLEEKLLACGADIERIKG